MVGLELTETDIPTCPKRRECLYINSIGYTYTLYPLVLSLFLKNRNVIFPARPSITCDI